MGIGSRRIGGSLAVANGETRAGWGATGDKLCARTRGDVACEPKACLRGSSCAYKTNYIS